MLGQQLGRVELQALRRAIGHVNPRHPLRSPLTVRDIVLTGITATIETPPRWQPTAAAAGTALDAITSEHVSAAFSHPIDVQFDDGRWRARAATRQRAGA